MCLGGNSFSNNFFSHFSPLRMYNESGNFLLIFEFYERFFRRWVGDNGGFGVCSLVLSVLFFFVCFFDFYKGLATQNGFYIY